MTVARFLAPLTPSGSVEAAWGRQRTRLLVTSYVTTEIPPVALVTSVRAVVRRDDKVVALRNPDGVHVMPGGRLEPDESFEQALRREVHEETGLTLVEPRYVGFLHFEHLTAKPDNYRYPYPDGFHAMYVAVARGVLRSGDIDGWEEEAFLVSAEEARRYTRHAYIAPFVDLCFSASASAPKE